jgi:hypothetical protein
MRPSNHSEIYWYSGIKRKDDVTLVLGKPPEGGDEAKVLRRHDIDWGAVWQI